MRHILYVEDNLANSELMQSFFNMFDDFELQIVETAELGLKMIANQVFDLVLMDINLPDMDGISRTEHLKEQQGTKYVPIIAITAHAMPQDVEKGSEVFDAYITKPVDFSILSEELQRYL